MSGDALRESALQQSPEFLEQSRWCSERNRIRQQFSQVAQIHDLYLSRQTVNVVYCLALTLVHRRVSKKQFGGSQGSGRSHRPTGCAEVRSTQLTFRNFRIGAGHPLSCKSIPRRRKMCSGFQGSGEMQQRRILESVRAILHTASYDGDLIEIALPHSGLCHRLQIENLL